MFKGLKHHEFANGEQTLAFFHRDLLYPSRSSIRVCRRYFTQFTAASHNPGCGFKGPPPHRCASFHEYRDGPLLLQCRGTQRKCLPRPTPPRRSPSHSSNLRLVRTPVGTMTPLWISMLLRRKVRPFPVAAIGRVKKAAVGASKRTLSTFFSHPSFSELISYHTIGLRPSQSSLMSQPRWTKFLVRVGTALSSASTNICALDVSH